MSAPKREREVAGETEAAGAGAAGAGAGAAAGARPWLRGWPGAPHADTGELGRKTESPIV